MQHKFTQMAAEEKRERERERERKNALNTEI